MSATREDRTMSDDLVARLRAMGSPPPLDDHEAVMSYVLAAEQDAIAAADRIEELTAELDRWERAYVSSVDRHRDLVASIIYTVNEGGGLLEVVRLAVGHLDCIDPVGTDGERDE